MMMSRVGSRSSGSSSSSGSSTKAPSFCLASDIKVFNERLVRLNERIYCIVTARDRRFVRSILETQDPLYVSDMWAVFRGNIYSLSEHPLPSPSSSSTSLSQPSSSSVVDLQTAFRRDYSFTPREARVRDVNDVAVLFSDGSVIDFVHGTEAAVPVNLLEYPNLTPNGFAVHDVDHTKVLQLDSREVVIPVNIVPPEFRTQAITLNVHGDRYLRIMKPSSSHLNGLMPRPLLLGQSASPQLAGPSNGLGVSPSASSSSSSSSLSSSSSSLNVNTDEQWIVTPDGRKVRLLRPLVKIHRTHIELSDQMRMVRNPKTGVWDYPREQELKFLMEHDPVVAAAHDKTKQRNWFVSTDELHVQTLVRVCDFRERNASGWQIMNTALVLK